MATIAASKSKNADTLSSVRFGLTSVSIVSILLLLASVGNHSAISIQDLFATISGRAITSTAAATTTTTISSGVKKALLKKL